jgi:hypothetical protein
MSEAKYEWKELLNLTKLNAGCYFGFDELLSKFAVSLPLQDARMFNLYRVYHCQCTSQSCDKPPFLDIREHMVIVPTNSMLEAACTGALEVGIAKEYMTLQRILDVYVPNLLTQKRCACTSICAMTLHSLSMPHFLLVDIAFVSQPMVSDYVLIFVDIEFTFCDQVYDLLGVGYLVNGNHFISRFMDRTSSVPMMWEADGMHRDKDTRRRGRYVQLSINGKPIKSIRCLLVHLFIDSMKFAELVTSLKQFSSSISSIFLIISSITSSAIAVIHDS